MLKFYKYDGKLIQFEEKQLSEILGRLEISLRKGVIRYTQDGVCQEQLVDIKNKWPEALKDFLKEKAVEMAKPSKPDPMSVKNAMSVIVENECRKRANRVEESRRASALAYQFKVASSDLAVSMLFGKAPAIDPRFPRVIETLLGEIPVSIQVSERPVRLVVESSAVQESKIYLSGIYLPSAKRTYLVGWAGQKQVMAAPAGSQDTDPDNCSWKRPAHYVEFEDLKPMSDLLAKMQIKQVPEGLLFETVPDKQSLPLLTNLSPIDTSKNSGDDYGSFFKRYMKDEPQETETPVIQVPDHTDDAKKQEEDMSLLDF